VKREKYMDKMLDLIKIADLAEKIGGELYGENLDLTGIASIEEVKKGEITWAENKKALDRVLDIEASAVIVSHDVYEESKQFLNLPCITVKNPRASFAQALTIFYKRVVPTVGIAETAVIGKNVKIEKNVYVGDYAIISENSVIGEGSSVYPHTYIGRNVTVGQGSVIYPFVSVYDHSKIGNSVVIHSGAVIGADGFGFVEVNGKQVKIPQVGIVELGDGVEIGANVTIDRATTGVTLVGAGSKIDNLVQIGHNCKLGKNNILVSQSGAAGSCVLGDNVTMAAQSGLAPHVKIGSNTVIGGRGGVTHDIPANSVVSGFPAKPHKEALKIRAAVGRLPATMKNLKEMEKRIETLENIIKELTKNHE
jgi:UDP-3-O-[3-hydroxymyristoyl] glucosamine N-acyltransferase